MTHDIDITDTPERVVTLSFCHDISCWVFESDDGPADRASVRLTKAEALAAAKYIQEYYA